MKKKLPFILLTFFISAFHFLSFKTFAQTSFSSATNFPVNNHPVAVTYGDYNGDGKTDLATANTYGTGNISVLMGDGTGQFGTGTTFTLNGLTLSILGADLNMDGKTDLVVTNVHFSCIHVLLANTTGSFTISTFPTDASPQAAISDDFNDDGNPDLAIACGGANSVSVLLGNGTGSFGVPVNFPVGIDPLSIVSTDFNNDGFIDLAVANNISNYVSVLLGNGSGSFGLRTDFPVGSYPCSLITEDFNSDGDADLAVANRGENEISVLLGKGTGNFSPPIDFPVGNSPSSVVCSDYNLDGNTDLAVTNEDDNNVHVLLGDGNGNFGSINSFMVGANPRAITCADFNGDGKSDIATSNRSEHNVSVLLNNLSTSICLVTVDPTLTHNMVIWEKTGVAPTIDSFIVYREMSTNNYHRIGAVSVDSMSIFDDLNINPSATACRYKLKSKNNLGAESAFSNFHNTIYLTRTDANFSWTPYQIEHSTTPVLNYNIYRDNHSSGTFYLIGNTTGNQFGYTDVNFYDYPNSSYYVEAVIAGGSCIPTRLNFSGARSNILNNISTIYIFPNPTNNILNITGIKSQTTLRMFDVVGNLVMQKEVDNNTTISTSQYAQGIYTLFSESKTDRGFKKVVISR